MSTVTRRRYAKRLQPSERREQVLDAALGVILDSGDFHVTMEAIAAAAGVTKPVVYDYFANLGELLDALLDRESERCAEMVTEVVPDLSSIAGKEPDDLIVEQTAAFLQTVQRHPDTWRFMLLPPAGAPPELRRRFEQGRDRARQALTLVIAWGIATRGGPAGFDTELFAETMLAFGQRAAELVLLDGEAHPPERFAELVRVLISGLPRD